VKPAKGSSPKRDDKAPRGKRPAGASEPRVTLRDRAAALGLSLVWAALLLVAQRDTGFMRDEGTYFHAGRQAWEWVEDLVHDPHAALTRAGIDRRFSYNSEHPALMKILFGASEALVHRRLGWASASTAFRLPGILLSALAVGLIYLFGAAVHSRRAGLCAALLYAALPRAFFHAQLATFDGAVATTWLAVVWTYWRALTRPWMSIVCGLWFGVALATKLNAFFLPPVLLLHWLAHVGLGARGGRGDRSSGWVFVAMAVLGPAVLVGHWPWLWTDTGPRLSRYVAFHLHHAYYNTAYFGVNYNRPPLPWSYPFVMTAFTTPAVTLALALPGLLLLLRRPNKLALLWVLNLLVPILLIAWPTTPIFGGTKHWLNAMPFLALLSGVALARVTEGLGRIGALVIALAVAPGAADAWHSHPFGLAQYSALAGGAPGAADLGMLRQFWGYPTRALLPWLDETLPRGTSVYWHDTNHDSVAEYQREGLLRRDLGDAGMEEPAVRRSDAALVIHELHFAKYEHMIWNAYGTATPARVLALDGVPLVTVYGRPHR
jgi:4-amino-4-deoxy-L-arabinose transferase-like glycosyltransferase